MRIAISATGPTIDAEIDPRFGRCQYFIIVDMETMEYEALENSSSMASGGAGISTGQMIVGKGVEAVLTGNCGPNAYQVLSAAGLQVITGISGKVQDAIKEYKLGTYSAAQQPNVADHYGMSSGGGGGGGGGIGMGRGMGKGMGRGMGKGMGAGMIPPAGPVPPPQSTAQDLEALKAQSQALAQQLAEIQRSIEKLEKKDK